MYRLLLSGVLVLGLMCGAMASEPPRQHGAHAHGHASGTLALDDNRLDLALDIPGANLVGFEHPPRSEEHKAALARMITELERGHWLVADARGGCEIARITVDTPGFGHTHDHDHDHDHDHNRDHKRHDPDRHVHYDHDAHDHHEHAEFRVAAVLECQSPGQLRWLELGLLDAHPGNEQMTIDVLTDSLATRVRLVPGRQRIELRD